MILHNHSSPLFIFNLVALCVVKSLMLSAVTLTLISLLLKSCQSLASMFVKGPEQVFPQKSTEGDFSFTFTMNFSHSLVEITGYPIASSSSVFLPSNIETPLWEFQLTLSLQKFLQKKKLLRLVS